MQKPYHLSNRSLHMLCRNLANITATCILYKSLTRLTRMLSPGSNRYRRWSLSIHIVETQTTYSSALCPVQCLSNHSSTSVSVPNIKQIRRKRDIILGNPLAQIYIWLLFLIIRLQTEVEMRMKIGHGPRSLYLWLL